MKYKNDTCKFISVRAFTITELAIVILIVALLISTVLVGNSLVRSSEVKTIIAQVSDFKGVVDQFKVLYSQLPGDMNNASSFLDGANNGNGDGDIASETSNEAFMVFDHLQKADLIKGSYSGTWSSGFVGGTNVKKLEKNGALMYMHCCSSTDYSRTIDYDNHVTVFAVYTSNDDYREGTLTPIEASNIDKKLDDGLPDFGFVGASGSYTGSAYAATGCYSGTGASSVYLTSDSSYKEEDGCQVHFAYDW